MRTILGCCLFLIGIISNAYAGEYISQRPKQEDRLFTSIAIEKEIERITSLLTNPKLAWMFANCFPNVLETTVHYRIYNGKPDTFVYTGDIHAMWLRDSAAQVWPYVEYASKDLALRQMIWGVINRQFMLINLDPYANAFNDKPNYNNPWMKDNTIMIPEVHERKWELDSPCYPIRLAYHYWKCTNDSTIFAQEWLNAIRNILKTFKEQQRKADRLGPYYFTRYTNRAVDTKLNNGYGSPVKPIGLIASSFRPSDDATIFEFHIPSNFFAITTLRKAAEILYTVNNDKKLADECLDLANEVESALKKYAIYNHPKYGPIYAYEIDGFGNQVIMDDANVPSLLSMPYLGDMPVNDLIYQNTRKFIWSFDNPYFFKGSKGEGVGGPHIGFDMVWPMSIMMRAFTSTNDEEIKTCVQMILETDADTGFIHESFNVNNPAMFTRKWFAWQNALFGELIIKLIKAGKLELLNSIPH